MKEILLRKEKNYDKECIYIYKELLAKKCIVCLQKEGIH